MAKIEIEINDAQVTAAFDRIVDISGNPSPLLEAFGNSLEKSIRFCFLRSSDPYGRPWQPLKVRNGKPLEDTGHFRDSFTHAVDVDSVFAGTNAVQAALQNFGGTIVPKNKEALRFFIGGFPAFASKVTIPARPMIPNAAEGLPKEWADDLLSILHDAIEGAITGGK